MDDHYAIAMTHVTKCLHTLVMSLGVREMGVNDFC